MMNKGRGDNGRFRSSSSRKWSKNTVRGLTGDESQNEEGKEIDVTSVNFTERFLRILESFIQVTEFLFHVRGCMFISRTYNIYFVYILLTFSTSFFRFDRFLKTWVPYCATT